MLLEQLSLHAFIHNNKIRTETGDELDFKKYRFMYDIYADRSSLICCMKCAQIGFTTYEILKTAHECKNDKIDILYVLPTADDVKRFSGGKTNKILSQNPVLQTWTKDKDSIEQKQFGDNTVYYQGSWTERAALMITAKKLVVDEYDRCKPEIVEQYDSRLQSVADPKKAFFSNPSLPDFGIDIWYKKSDQKKWHITHSCGERYVMDESCIDYDQEIYKCPHCQGEITDEERTMGEWIATSEGEWSGYWIPLWIAPWMPASKIAQMKREKTGEFFSNFVAGLPFVNVNNQIPESSLTKSLVSSTNTQEGKIVIGVDTGHNIHFSVANKEGFFYHGYCQSVDEYKKEHGDASGYDPYDQLDALMKRFPNAVMVADQGGDLIGIRKLQAKYPGRVYLCWFTKETKNQQIIRWGDNDEDGKVLVDRNRAIQLFVDEIRETRIPFFGTKEDWMPWFRHALNIYKVKEIVGEENDPQYGWRWVWKRKGPDHWFLSGVYARVGLDRFSEEAVVVSRNKFTQGIETGRVFNINQDWESEPIIFGEDL